MPRGKKDEEELKNAGRRALFKGAGLAAAGVAIGAGTSRLYAENPAAGPTRSTVAIAAWSAGKPSAFPALTPPGTTWSISTASI